MLTLLNFCIMNLHLSTDDKFLDYFILNAEIYTQTKNTYVVFSEDETLIHTKSKDVIHIKPTVESFKKVYDKLSGIKRVFLHGLNDVYSDVVFACNLHEHYKLIWLFWGYEVFSLHEFRVNLFLPETKKYYVKNEDTVFRFTLNPIQLRRNIINYKHYSAIQKSTEYKLRKLINVIHFMAHFIPEDYERYVKPLNKSIQYIDWNYGGVNRIRINPAKKSNRTLKNIVLGNSASMFNNHLDGLNHLKNHFDSELIDKIICPLSYSGTVKYIAKVKSYGKALFGDKFMPLVAFLTKEEYFKLMQNVDFAVYYNIRSQAGGNILFFLKNGIPVFMNEQSSLYKLLQKKGYNVFPVKSLSLQPEIKANSIFHDLLFNESQMRKKYERLLHI